MEASNATFCGRLFTPSEVELVREVLGTFGGLSRIELARTVCELLEWTRPNGGLKGRECLDLLERLERDGLIELPEKRPGRPVGTRTRVPHTAEGDPRPPLQGEISTFQPIVLEQVQDQEQRLLFRELVGRHHYLGHAVPFGAHLRYLAYASKPERVVVGCLQFSSPAWRMAVRDRWIGWDEATRKRNLQRIVNNSRFLILPWVRVRNLASTVLSLGARGVEQDWPARYGIEPLLFETLVDRSRYGGGCYRAANWVELGVTAGRGRMDREHARHDASPKTVLIYPLVRNVCRRLREG
ncbi:MAG: DUF4338 domain-containing protein [Candidatus Rokubacteria bacterium]|nr:DUF4338 domain-containing protein [Candidatus Rokubacteria bacterium]